MDEERDDLQSVQVFAKQLLSPMTIENHMYREIDTKEFDSLLLPCTSYLDEGEETQLELEDNKCSAFLQKTIDYTAVAFANTLLTIGAALTFGHSFFFSGE
mmetsp:Transcript_19099/g.43478  ORF Transcript_19099/g.43478 Transcript_19099/m.43478 type:complete len:101 (+) Transcript_19099:109-411(+)